MLIISAQKWIDGGGIEGKVTSAECILEIYRRFCEFLPEDMLLSENPVTGEAIQIIPGEMRYHDVKVGRHSPISPGALPRFLKHFERTYSKLGKVDSVISAATADYRLLWMHPFLDGNGRVARLGTIYK